MPTTKFQKVIFALLSVIISVHCFVFYNIAVESGGMSNKVFLTAKNVILIEFIIAFLLEMFVVGPISTKIVLKKINFAKEKQTVITTTIICTTICLMCPMMSLIATILYNGLNIEFLANWMQKLVINFPFAFFIELFFVQPIVRKIFNLLFKRKDTNTEINYKTNFESNI